jgi:hypothetical protein
MPLVSLLVLVVHSKMLSERMPRAAESVAHVALEWRVGHVARLDMFCTEGQKSSCFVFPNFSLKREYNRQKMPLVRRKYVLN